MENFMRLMRVAGVNFPVAASFIQISNELDSIEIQKRLTKLEDPISSLHEDIPSLSHVIYIALAENDSSALNFRDDVYDKYSRAFAKLDSQGLITKHNQAGTIYPALIEVSDASYIAYLATCFEDTKKMDLLFTIVDSCKVGTWLNGHEIQKDIQLPLVVIKAIFDIFASNGFGICSRNIGECTYLANA